MRDEAAIINRLPFLIPVPDYVRADEVSEVAWDVLIPCILKSAADAQGGTLTLI
jgi:hypothetical protein